MKDKIIIITNESFYESEKNKFYCDNIDLKSIPEELNKFFEINIIGRKSNKKRSKKIELNKIKVFKHFFIFI